MNTTDSLYPALRTFPEKIVLKAEDTPVHGVKPPVRIFLGTEPAQYKAERIFIWSIEKHRDPTRIYEIFLMKNLAGFQKKTWTTGFTNYRFAIPSFCENKGKAIYNDVDQMYFSDPGELFDTNLNGHGFLAISKTESSVLLLDCERMGAIWSLEDAQQLPKKQLLARALSVPNLYGELSPFWNSRDEEFCPGQSKLLHFTTLHTQPWRPFPKRFIYDRHPFAETWDKEVQEADKVVYQVFTKNNPSQNFQMWRQLCQENFTSHGVELSVRKENLHEKIYEEVSRLIRETQSSKILNYGSALHSWKISPPQSNGDKQEVGAILTPEVRFFSPLTAQSKSPQPNTFDNVVCLNWLDKAPTDDMPWLLDDIFQLSRRLVIIAVSPTESKEDFYHAFVKKGPYGQHFEKSEYWWVDQLQNTSKRFPSIFWTLAVDQPDNSPSDQIRFHTGGKNYKNSQLTVWALLDDQPGNSTQSLGLAQSLGWPMEVKHLRFKPLSRIREFFADDSPQLLLEAPSSPLVAPWPDLVIATGKRPSRIAKWIKQESLGKTKLIQIGRKGGIVADDFDLVITPNYCRQTPHPHRLTSLLPPTQASLDKLQQAKTQWHPHSEHDPQPRVVVLVGGNTKRHAFHKQEAIKFARDIKGFAQELNGSVYVTTSRRTGEEASQALMDELAGFAKIYQWKQDQKESPYWGLLAWGDVIIVTGESESMIAEAAGTGKPLYIYGLPTKPLTLKGKLKEWIVQKAHHRPLNNRGTVRPQQKLELFCAWLIAKGWVLPMRDLTLLHQSLYDRGIAKPFGDSTPFGARSSYQEIPKIIPHIHTLMGYSSTPKTLQHS